MSSVNNSNSSIPSFILMGFLEVNVVTNLCFSCPLCLLYLFSFLVNGLILFIIKSDKRLHTPMFLLISMLAVTDLGESLATLPTVLGRLLFDFRNINFYICLTQLFFVHTFALTGSTILMAMAFDRYVAICNPLRYASILHAMISKIGPVALARGVCFAVPFPIFLTRLHYCDNKKVYHAFCFHPDVMKLACTDPRLTSTYGVFIVISVFLDLLCILFSYLMILRAVLAIAKSEESRKTFSTCVSHICVVLIFYSPLIGLAGVHRSANNASPFLPVLMGLAYACIPPGLNPLIYIVKTKQIWTAIHRHLCLENLLTVHL
ncbi:olfactory receptor 51G2-like [Pleurodeles waltl]|uniref:olfactory receptor 51G2-like n=1 Tax=Pleurodeles waltl TaxID=8319 RepID=UPI0037098076